MRQIILHDSGNPDETLVQTLTEEQYEALVTLCDNFQLPCTQVSTDAERVFTMRTPRITGAQHETMQQMRDTGDHTRLRMMLCDIYGHDDLKVQFKQFQEAIDRNGSLTIEEFDESRSLTEELLDRVQATYGREERIRLHSDYL